MLEQLIAYAQDSTNGIWLTTVAEVADYINKKQSEDPTKTLRDALTFHASFDHGFDADYHQGNGSVYTASEYGKLEDSKKGMHADLIEHRPDSGRYGGAIKYTGKSQPVLYYKSEDNIAYNPEDWNGTISMWLQLDPEQDLEPGYCDPIQITDVGYNDAALWVDFSDKNPRSFRMGVFGDLEVWNPRNISPDKNIDFSNRLLTAKDRPFSRDQWTHVVISYQSLGTTKRPDIKEEPGEDDQPEATSDQANGNGEDNTDDASVTEPEATDSPDTDSGGTDNQQASNQQAAAGENQGNDPSASEPANNAQDTSEGVSQDNNSSSIEGTDSEIHMAKTGRADFYINGIHQGSRDIPEPFTWDLEKSKIFLGLNYVGMIDDLAIFNKGLSEEEVGILYGLEKGVKELW